MAKRAVIVHGWGGSPEDGWAPWLRGKLEERGFSVSVPRLPDTHNPEMGAWVRCLSEAVGSPDEDLYFVGHSLGNITIFRYLETLEGTEKVGGAVLVAALIESEKPKIRQFFEAPIEWDRIRGACHRFVAINSDDDPHVPLSHGEAIRENLGAELIVQENKGHFSSGDGFEELPVALESVLRISES